MKFDYSNLKGEIKKKFNSVQELADETNLGLSTLNDHIRLGTPFRTDQIYKILRALSISITSEQVIDLFFVVK